MMLRIGMEVDQDYTVFNYVPPRPQKDLKSQDRTIVAGPEVKPENFLSQGTEKRKSGRTPPPRCLGNG